MMKVEKKEYENDDHVLLSLCLRGAKTRGKDGNDHKSSSSFVFHRNDEGQKKK
jgi:hypothetical protein